MPAGGSEGEKAARDRMADRRDRMWRRTGGAVAIGTLVCRGTGFISRLAHEARAGATTPLGWTKA